MGTDAKTLMLMSLAIALIAGIALLGEGRATRERAQSIWGLGFLTIVLGCAMTPLRNGISFELGVWFADGLLVVAHILFLLGSVRFVGRPSPLGVWAVLGLWLPLVAWPADASRTTAFALVNAGLVAGLSLGSAGMLLRYRPPGDWASGRLAAVFGIHGLFYTVKAALVWVPGGFVDIVALKGVVIQLSLVEGILIETLLLLVMTASARRRREVRLASLAESDPLTGLLNRRAFDEHARMMLHHGEPDRLSSALLLCDLDHFKAVNDTYGHAAGDRILIAFADLLRTSLPPEALIARYGGDEFVALLPDIDDQALSRVGAILRNGAQAAGHRTIARAVSTTVTIGTARAAPGTDLAALLNQADAAAYEAKRRGRDQIFNAGRAAVSDTGLPETAGRFAGRSG